MPVATIAGAPREWGGTVRGLLGSAAQIFTARAFASMTRRLPFWGKLGVQRKHRTRRAKRQRDTDSLSG